MVKQGSGICQPAERGEVLLAAAQALLTTRFEMIDENCVLGQGLPSNKLCLPHSPGSSLSAETSALVRQTAGNHPACNETRGLRGSEMA